MTEALNLDISQISKQQSKTQASGSASAKQDMVSKTEFLELLTTQLKHQNPLKPMKDKEFVAQMAQFSALEQMQNLNSSFKSTKALNMVGKNVVGKTVDDKNASEVSGKVESVKISDDKAFAVVNGKEIPVDSITEVKEASDNKIDNKETQQQTKVIDLSKYTGLIDKNVKSMVKGLEQNAAYELDGKVHSISSVQNKPVLVLDNVKATIDSLGAGQEVGNVKEYLQNKVGEKITAVAKDQYGTQTKITGEVASVTGDSAHPQVTFDGVRTTADSIYEIY